ncbi:MAG: type IX secretion system protein PorQ [Candidatus Azobacteroides sp.]|nr:type IX secretion system protein PorQ [Candidatus Azobacteroides sp.]
MEKCIFVPMKKCLIFVLYIMLLSGRAFAQGPDDAAFKFLNLSTSARANALGGNNISIVEKDISLIYQNPALLGPELDKQLNLNFTAYMEGIKLGSVTFGKAVNNRSAWGIGMHYLDYGTIVETSPDGSILGDFSVKDLSLSGFYGYDFSERLRGGFAIKAIYSSYAEFTSFALGVDLGLNYYNVDKGFSGSLTFKNLGGQLVKYDEISEKMPWDIQLGISQKLEHAPIRFSITAQHLNKWDLTVYPTYETDANGILVEKKDSFGKTLLKHFIFGVDVLPTQNVWLAVGYNFKRKEDLQLAEQRGLTGFTAGAGIKVSSFQAGFSLSQMHVGALSYSFSISTNLGAFNL